MSHLNTTMILFTLLFMFSGCDRQDKNSAEGPNKDEPQEQGTDQAANVKDPEDKAPDGKKPEDQTAADKAAADKAAADKAAADKAAADKAAADKALVELTFAPNEAFGKNFISDIKVEGQKIYIAGDYGLQISADGGKTWSIKGIDEGLGGGIGKAVCIDGSNIYVAHAGISATQGGLSISKDGGRTWIKKNLTDGLGSMNVNDVYAQGATIYAATDGGLSISYDGGTTWINETTNDGLGDNRVTRVLAVRSTVYAVTKVGISISEYKGQSWFKNQNPLGTITDTYSSIHATDSTVYFGTSSGIAMTKDNGQTWTESSILLGYGVGETQPPFGAATPHEQTYSIFSDGKRIYAATRFGLSISNDDGKTWVNKRLNDSNEIWSNAVFVTNDRIYLGTEDGLLESDLK